MLEEYLGQCGPYSAFVDVISLNDVATEFGADVGEHQVEIVDTLPTLLPNPEEECLKKDILSKIGKFVEGLPTCLRQVAILHYWDGRTQRDIAQEMGISQSAVSQRLAKITALGRSHFGLFMN